MLVIRQAQIDALALAMNEQFQQRVLHFIESSWPPHIPRHPPHLLNSLIKEAIESATSQDILAETDIVRYTLCIVALKIVALKIVALKTEPGRDFNLATLLEHNADSNMTGQQKAAACVDATLQYLKQSHDFIEKGLSHV